MKKAICIILIIMLINSQTGCVAERNSVASLPENDQVVSNDPEPITDSVKENDPQKGGMLIAVTTADAPTIDPQGKAPTTFTTALGTHIGEGLIRTRGNDILPGMAKTWEISEDGLSYVFHIRDAEWSDGENVKAGDFVYSMRRLVDPKTASNEALQGYYIKNGLQISSGEMAVEELGVEAVDDKTLKITLENPCAFFLRKVAENCFAPVRQDIVEKYGTSFASSGDTMVYNGPFVIKEWRVEDEIQLVKNEAYWNAEEIYLDGITFKVVSNADTAASMFETGQVNYVPTVSSSLVPLYGDQVTPIANGFINYIRFNLDGSNQITSNLNFRQAFISAFDRTEFSMLSSEGKFKPNNRFVNLGVSGAEGYYVDEFPYPPQDKANIEQAKEYLTAAMEELKIEKASDITLELLTKDDDDSRKEAQIIQDMMLKNLGINLTVRSLPFAEWLVKHKEHTYEIISCANSGSYDPYSYLELYPSTSSYNHASYNNPKFDKLIDESMLEPDPMKRMSILFEAEKLLIEDGAGCPTVDKSNFSLIDKRIKNAELGFVSASPDFVYAYFE